MSNMSYCRFENTYSDLQDCVRALDDGKTLSEEEAGYAKRMKKLCEDFISALDNRGDTLTESDKAEWEDEE